MFRATPFLQTFSHYETSCFAGVTLNNVSCDLSRFDDHMRLQEHFHWLVPQTVAKQEQDRCYTAQCLKKLLQPFRKVERNSTFRNGFCNWSHNVFGRCKVCYIG